MSQVWYCEVELAWDFLEQQSVLVTDKRRESNAHWRCRLYLSVRQNRVYIVV